MKLDRATNGTGKYAVINMRRASIAQDADGRLQQAFNLLLGAGLIELGEPGTKNEFFVVMLKDVHSQPALMGYANSAFNADPEYAEGVFELARRAGRASPFCKEPD